MEQVIIWDADGVLFDTFAPDGTFCWSQTIKSDLGIYESLLGQIFSGDWIDVVRGRIDAHTHVERVFQTNLFPLSADVFIDYWLSKDNLVNPSVTTYLGAFPSCIGTNQPLVRAEKMEEWFEGRLRKIFASSRMGGHMKPEDGFYDYIEHDLALAPAQLCLIDDDAQNVQAARLRGWGGHHFTNVASLNSFMRDPFP